MNYTVFMTNRCNLRCNYCYEGNKKEKSISYEVLNALVEYIEKNDDKVSIVIHGGEPLLEFEKIKYLISELDKRKEKITYSITTNGTVMNEKIARYVIENINSLSISIDGIKAQHDLNRVDRYGKGTYETVFYNIEKYLGDKKKIINARMTINTLNYKKIDENIIHLIEKGFGSITPVINQFDSWTLEEWDELNRKLKNVKQYIEKERIEAEIGLIYDAKYKCKNGECDGGITTIVVDCDGKLYPCVVVNGEKEYCIGDIYNGINKDKLEKIHAYDKDLVDLCIGCKRYDYCEATRCKIINKYQTGSWNTPSVNVCKIQNVKVALAVN